MKYQVEFFSNWHCGSGQAAGADADELVIKDPDGLPFIPGKTIKGLLREAVASVLHFGGSDDMTLVDELFGSENQQGKLHFTNASLSEALTQHVKSSKECKALSSMLYQILASTAIGDDGLAKDHSLRRVRTTIPCTLYGEIRGLESEEQEVLLEDALHFVKRLGLGRNRGYGRCKLSRVEE